jgi:superfamily II DNA or RNA helicase
LSVKLAAPSLRTGQWAQNQISWSDINNHTDASRRISSTIVDILQTLWILQPDDRYSYDNAGALSLNLFSNRRVWALLEEVKGLGVPLICAAKGNPELDMDHDCRIELDIADQKTGGLEVAPKLAVDGKLLPKNAEPKFIGDPPIGIYWTTGLGPPKNRTIHVAKLIQQPSKFLVKAVKDSATLAIPKEDKEEFSEKYFPQIARSNAVNTRRVKTIKLKAPERPKLHVSITAHKSGVRAHLGFAYQVDDKPKIVSVAPDNASTVNRDQLAENQLLSRVESIIGGDADWFDQPDVDGGVTALKTSVTLSGLDAVRFVQETVPRFKSEPDIIVDMAADIPDYHELEGAPNISYNVDKRDDDSQDWFNLAVEITVGDVTIPFKPLFAALADNETSLMLDDGSYLMLSHPELLELRKLIIEARQLGDKTSDELSISRFQASLWEDLQRLGVVKKQAEEWNAAVRGLLDVKQIPKVAVPKQLKATLRPYQKEGFRWLYFLWQHRLGGILADDMGLGKTLQTIALLLAIKSATSVKDRKPVLIIAPTSVAANWMHELDRFAPSLKVIYVRQVPKDKKAFDQEIRQADVIVSSYGLFRLGFDAYQAHSWAALVLDEAQFVKNHQSKGYQNARRLAADFKLALTGTPLENNLMELWALLSIAAPGLFPSPKHFTDFYQKPIEKEADRDKLAQLRQRVRPLMLRRTKEQVVTELPPKIEQIIELELEPEHRKIYDTYLQRERQRVLGLLGDMDKNRFMIFKSLTTLRMLSLAPQLVDEKYRSAPSTKLKALSSQLQEIISEDHRVLVFSQFTSFLKMVQNELTTVGIPYCYLDGSTRNRGDLLKEFKSSNTPVFLISLKAGGFGLNLTEADYCILLDPWWNPAVENQAVDRAHRIGQTKQVIVYRMVSKDTIEEKVMALKAKKSKLFSSMLDDNATFSSGITVEDIQGLFD